MPKNRARAKERVSRVGHRLTLFRPGSSGTRMSFDSIMKSAVLLALAGAMSLACGDSGKKVADAGDAASDVVAGSGGAAGSGGVGGAGGVLGSGGAMDASADASPLERCLSTGGTQSTALCCAAVTAFPSSCTTGQCGCAPASSHQVDSCTCPTGKCFDPAQGCITKP